MTLTRKFGLDSFCSSLQSVHRYHLIDPTTKIQSLKIIFPIPLMMRVPPNLVHTMYLLHIPPKNPNPNPKHLNTRPVRWWTLDCVILFNSLVLDQGKYKNLTPRFYSRTSKPFIPTQWKRNVEYSVFL